MSPPGCTSPSPASGSLTGGTRAYAGIRGGPLAFDAIHSITGRREAVALTGRATLP